jgi:ssDNA-binding Zn-finger/Zn-ribbon topoisomerase 1
VRKFQPVPTDRACEKCGALLVIRVSARRQQGPRPFLSCSAFPKCRAATDLPPELAPLGEQARGRWQANAIKNKADLEAFLAAQAERPGAEPPTGEAGEEPV